MIGIYKIENKVNGKVYIGQSNNIEVRWDLFLKNIKGVGPATISEMLTYINPQEYAIFNKTTILCYTYLDIPDMPKYNYQYTGKKYVEICKVAKYIASEIEILDGNNTDLLTVDYFKTLCYNVSKNKNKEAKYDP